MENSMLGLTPNELADTLGITVQGVYRILAAKDIKSPSPGKRKLIQADDIRNILSERGFKYPKLNMSCQVVKGGAGKTTIAFNLASRATYYGVRVLAIDFDQQGNLTRSFNVDSQNRPVWINIFRKEKTIQEAIVPVTEYLHLIPSNLNNSRLDTEMVQKSTANLKDMLNDILEPVRDNYDLVIMDCPPSINRVNAAVTCASDLVVIPINPDQYSIDGLTYTISELNELKNSFKMDKPDYKILWNRYDAREKLATIYTHLVAKDETHMSNLLPMVIRSDTALKNVILEGTNIFENKRKTVAKEDMDQLTRELIGLNDWADRVKDKREERKEVLA